MEFIKRFIQGLGIGLLTAIMFGVAVVFSVGVVYGVHWFWGYWLEGVTWFAADIFTLIWIVFAGCYAAGKEYL